MQRSRLILKHRSAALALPSTSSTTAPEPSRLVRRYSVPGTLAHDLKAEPEFVALPDGRKIACKASSKVLDL